MAYAVRLEQFEGPLELLLQLIEKEKLDITRVSLARVADQYLEYIQGEADLPLASLTQFLSVAARLVLLKSRALLPLLVFTDEEETSIADLEWQLKEYKRYREASLALGKLLVEKRQAYPRERVLNGLSGMFFPPQSLSAEELRSAFVSVLGEIPLFEPLEEAGLQPVVRLEEKMTLFREMLTQRVETSFRTLTQYTGSRVELIVSFLALLQLIKERFVAADQSEYFGDITIRKSTPAEQSM